ncbi:MAG TPA: chemotaxis protein CheW [Anaeromyxobacteraceae bacterium]|nr:chemotaxis protein CheW [Anaeromyxobacteraceae bacterium]
MSDPQNEVLMFQVGPRVFATEVYDVLRVGSVRDVAAEHLVLDSILGVPFGRERGLVVGGQEREAELTLVIDQVIGIRAVAVDDLHALPPFAAAVMPSAAVTGFVMIDEVPTLLVDLPTLIRERLPAAAAAHAS